MATIDLNPLLSRIAEKLALNKEGFSNYKPSCQCCYGTGWFSVWDGDRFAARRCKGAIWSPDLEKFVCMGFPGEEKDLYENHKSLATTFWTLIAKLKLDEDKVLVRVEKKYGRRFQDLQPDQLHHAIILLAQKLS